jgi:hypothetical protein
LLGAPKGFRRETGQRREDDERGREEKLMSEEILEKGSLAGRGPTLPPPSYIHMDKANGHNNRIETSETRVTTKRK